MKLYVDLDSLQLVKIPGYSVPETEIFAHRGDSFPLIVQFVQSGAIVDPGAIALRFAAGAVYGTPIASVASFTRTGSGINTKFTGTLTLTSSDYTATLGTTTASVGLKAELTWTLSGATTSTRQFTFTVQNEIYAS